MKLVRTIAGDHLTREERQNAVEYPTDIERPKTRGDCLPGGCNEERPCPWVSCDKHLYLDVNPTSGSIKLNFPTLAVDELAETCSLDVADRGGVILDYVGDVMNLTRERIRQCETRALEHLQESPLMPASAGIFGSDR
jgi:hypothetical protein